MVAPETMGEDRDEKERRGNQQQESAVGISSGQRGNIFRSFSDLIEVNPQFTEATV